MPTVIKIDVEGHEVKAIEGFEELLAWPDVAIVAEAIDVMLRRAGHADALVELLISAYLAPSDSNSVLAASEANSRSPRRNLSTTQSLRIGAMLVRQAGLEALSRTHRPLSRPAERGYRSKSNQFGNAAQAQRQNKRITRRLNAAGFERWISRITIQLLTID